MKRFMSLVVLALLAAAPVLAGHPDKVKAELMRTEQALLDSMLKGDSTLFKTTMADSFVFIAPDGAMQKRAELLADLDKGDLKMAASSNDDMHVRLYGDTAVVTYRSTDKGTYKGRDISGKYRWTDVFVRQKGHWRIVSTQGTPIQ